MPFETSSNCLNLWSLQWSPYLWVQQPTGLVSTIHFRSAFSYFSAIIKNIVQFLIKCTIKQFSDMYRSIDVILRSYCCGGALFTSDFHQLHCV